MKFVLAVFIQGILVFPCHLLECNEHEFRLNDLICVIKCPLSCGGGVCLVDGTCKCDKGFQHPPGTEDICVTKCNNICETTIFGSAAK